MREYGTLRIVSENLADSAGLAASVATAPNLGLANVKNNLRTSVARFMSGTVVLTLELAKRSGVGCVALVGTNLSENSTAQVVCKLSGVTTYDSGIRYAVPGAVLDNWDFNQNLNVNNFQEGSATSTFWFDPTDCDSITVSIVDPSRAFLDIARVVVGPYFEPRIGASYGTGAGGVDTSRTVTTVSGDLRNDRRPKMRTLELKLDEVGDEDRHMVQRLLRDSGRWMLVAGAAADPDPVRDQDLTLYGQATQAGTLAYSTFARHQTTFPFEGWA